MKKLYSIVLMAAALLISTNTWATTRTASNASEFETAWKAAQNGDVIQLTANVSIGKVLWLGTTTMADLNPLSITLDLNGKKLTGTATKICIITHGELNVISSNGEGTIEHTAGAGKMSSTYEMFRVLGSTYKDVDPKTATSGYYSHLVLGENVKLIASNNAVVVDEFINSNGMEYIVNAWAAGNVTIPSTDAAKKALYTNVYRSDRGVANGVCIDIKGKIEAQKYAIKANGNLGVPANHTDASYPLSTHFQDRNGTAYEIVEGEQKLYSPFIHIHGTAELLTKNFTNTAAIAAYSGGYARWLVEGTCIGSTGVYVKSGELVLNNANIASNYTGTYQPAGESERSSGVDAGGSGIVMETAKAYAGEMDVTVQGDTKVTATVGYAIDEAVSPKSDSTKVDALTITGGTFEAGDKGTMHITEVTVEAHQDPNQETVITIIGGETISEKADSVGNMSLADFLADQQAGSGTATHITYVENEDGKTVMVISGGEAPVVNNKVSSASADASIKWQGPLFVKDTIKTALKLAELEINDTLANGDPREQILVINANATLEVGRVILGKGAQIIVEAGGKFIVSGAQGIVAPVVGNIILRNENGARSTFLFNPNVTSNKHPNATVEFITTAWWESTSAYQWENFGLPTHNALKSITCEKVGGNVVYEEIQMLNGSAWTSLGYIGGTYTIDVTKLSKPFAAYNIIAFCAKDETRPKCVMAGELVGNEDAALDAYMKWTPFANSYTADIDIYAFLQSLKTNSQSVDGSALYIAERAGNGSLVWNAKDYDDANEKNLKVKPMQAFLLNNKGAFSEVNAINYASTVYAPAVPGYAPAPRRSIATNENTAKMRVFVTNEEGVSDNVKLRETTSDNFAFEKYMNDEVNIYAMAEEKSAILTSDNIEDIYLGFSTVKGGNFTISFANVEGRDLMLIDHETGAEVLIAEGNTYEFTAAANSANDYRFEVVSPRKVTTAIENAEAVKNVKGIYTITGQYMGEMNVWNSLPAGVYVVNGEKRVK